VYGGFFAHYRQDEHQIGRRFMCGYRSGGCTGGDFRSIISASFLVRRLIRRVAMCQDDPILITIEKS
jgi:hypothetical protein